MKKTVSKHSKGRGAAPAGAASVCTNKDCVLKKEKGCKGFEACPGYKGR